ncbi:Brefeldin A-inhibited guanine nucleotide-exchange protein 1 [Fasciola hepatica]|uniref:Brefeldin A-inhibited guanine nucleotide-exchange protein 1 n=1 Tax=Fasciola hepatica TaxID=6192 RepID=A0A4E0RLX2_FASHE|nr:Brefeldin A-inhibited guanine nucleotide-exchange protein 1 [Fasciola hepatica]
MPATASIDPTDSPLPGPSDNQGTANKSTRVLSNGTTHSPPQIKQEPTFSDPHRQPQFSVSVQAFSMFLIKAIEKITAERETRKSQNTTLRKACEEALEKLRTRPSVSSNNKTTESAADDKSSDHLPPLKSDSGMLLADEKLLKPLQLACNMKSPKIVTTAVDTLQKLIAYGHVPNDAVGSSGKVRLIEQLVTTICSCFQGVHTDDGVQLQVLKALLTVVTSSVVEIHEADILLAVRTCYNIYMATKNPVNQATARATLTQIISIIFQRMEQNALDAVVALTTPPASSITSPFANTSTEEDSVGPIEDSGSPTIIQDALHTSSRKYSDSVEEKEEEQAQESQVNINENVRIKERDRLEVSEVVTPSGGDRLAVQIDENSETFVRDILEELINRVVPGENGNGRFERPQSAEAIPEVVHESIPAEFDSTSLHSSNDTKPIDHSENNNDHSVDPNVTPPEAVTLAHVTQKDAFLVFRSLCRLATKDFGGSRASDNKSNSVRSKTLSLQLLLSVFQQPGPLFLSSEIFITAIKQYLCVALIKNGVSPHPEICELSVTIFLSLLTHFKPHLKRHIEVFFKDVFLEILESPKSSFEHKWVVIEAVRRICADAQCVVDIYLNYDCDMNMANIFERLTTDLAKIAQGSYVGEHGCTIAQRQAIRTSGLECLVLILRCMVDWSHELYVSPELQSFLGTEPSVSTQAAETVTNGSVGVNHMHGVMHSKSVDDPGDFESRKAQKEIFESGIELFNKGRAMAAFQLLQEHSLLVDSVEAIAELLLVEERLSKASVGDFLGENDPFNLRVMYAYVDQFDFAEKDFVSAMREFLAGFRLPGEAQKIDRLMEKFAARYCACNPNNGLFASADTAYVLAFSIILLTTDLHSAQIKQHHRMTKVDYIRMNRGINDSQDLPESYLAQIYDEIAQCGIKLRSDDAISKLAGSQPVGTREDETGRVSSTAAKQESAIAGGDDIMGAIDCSESDFTSATHCEHVRPMFKLAWTPFLAAFSVGLQDCDALDVAHLCLEGIRYSIRIACIFHMEMERDAYVQALARFTLLLSASAVNHPLGSASVIGSNAGSNATHNRRSRTETTTSTTSTASSAGGSIGSGTAISGGTVGGVASAQSVPANTPMSITTSAATSIPEAMKQKNIDTIRTLITVAQTDGNYLGHAWVEILRCISQLESAQLIAQPNQGFNLGSSGSGLLTRAASFAGNPASHSGSGFVTGTSARRPVSQSSIPQPINVSSEPMAPGSLAAASVDPKKAAILQEVMGETGSHSVVVAVDKIFTGSVRLNGDAIVDFVKALCQVSREELTLPQPRIFTLQKVVEISYYNMGRIRLQWSRVWEHIGGHFTTAGQSSNEDVAEFVVDSLRQLSVKLIEKGELPNFHFQKEFLRPFVSILDNGAVLTRKIQDMVIRCVCQLVHSQYANIRSGWTNIFAAFHRVAGSADEAVVDLAFETCGFIVNEVLKNHVQMLLEAFQPLVKLLADFACNPHYPDMAMESIRLLRTCAEVVSCNGALFTTAAISLSSPTPDSGGVAMGQKIIGLTTANGAPQAVSPPPLSSSSVVQQIPSDEDHIWLRGWMPVLCELFRVINSCKLDVRTRGLTVFFDIIKTYGAQFKPLWWCETFTVIFRVFHHFRSPSLGPGLETTGESGLGLSSLERTEWMNTTCNHTLFSIVDVFSQFYEPLHSILLDEVYAQLRWCCLQEHEQLARSGTSCLETLILSTGKRFTYKIWERTVDLIVNLFRDTVPHQLLTWRPDTNSTLEDDKPSMRRSGSVGESNTGTYTHMPRYLVQAHLFADLLIKCVVQYELIQTVDHILFYSSHSRNEDAHYVTAARSLASASYPAYAVALVTAASVGSTAAAAPTDRTLGPYGWTNSSPQSIDTQWSPDETTESQNKHQEDSLTSPAVISNKSQEENDTFVSQEEEEEEQSWYLGPGGSRIALGPSSLPPDPRGMFACMSPQHRLRLARCLLESHAFAKQFNSNDEQRNVLFEAGFKVKAKPNLLKQETHSLLCALRILFRLAEEDSELREETEDLLDRVILDALSYYHGLVIDGHRQAWDTCLILIITQLTRLSPATRFHRHAANLYGSVCDLVAMAGGVSPEVASLIRLFMLRCGAFFVPPSYRAT